ncbi:MAG: PGF-pre-PGF domain-containing protein [Candidatus Methanoperedens sp.]|nr:PGF-pre-PGF domain-containing protein [Candidatus Methanoperedens sp.]
MGVLLFCSMTATSLEVTGSVTVTNTVSGGSTVTYSGGGGGGGGGLSGENFTNIEVNEKYFMYIYKDKVTSYRFTSSGNPVMFVNITGNTSPGDIRTSVEVLKDTSTLVKEPASGIVYRNANIWVGTSGFAVAKNIKEAVIRFRVENAWISSNGLSQGDITMFKWDGSNWIKLETMVDGKDSVYSYFEAKTYSFSSFAIVGLKGNDAATASKVAAGVTDLAGTAQAADAAQAEKSPGFGFASVIVAFCAFYIFWHRNG